MLRLLCLRQVADLELLKAVPGGWRGQEEGPFSGIPLLSRRRERLGVGDRRCLVKAKKATALDNFLAVRGGGEERKQRGKLTGALLLSTVSGNAMEAGAYARMSVCFCVGGAGGERRREWDVLLWDGEGCSFERNHGQVPRIYSAPPNFNVQKFSPMRWTEQPRRRRRP
ncbi:hypothetical protein GQ54DRAFT_171763 [Martensiomyces pterosporus]|nr:hypothetical protein GQ54DRAFT_171763 [Martensiomyces pterosporus]